MIGPTDIQIILGKVRPLSRPHPEAHPQVLIIARLEPDERFSDYGWFLNAIKLFANEGVPPYRRAINYLRSGIWLFRVGRGLV